MGTGQIFQAIISLAGVLGLCWVMLLGMKKLNGGTRAGPIHILSSRRLGGRDVLHWVSCGDQQMIITQGAHGIRFIAHINADNEIEQGVIRRQGRDQQNRPGAGRGSGVMPRAVDFKSALNRMRAGQFHLYESDND